VAQLGQQHVTAAKDNGMGLKQCVGKMRPSQSSLTYI